MRGFAESGPRPPRRNGALFIATLIGLAIVSVGAANAACRQPRMTGLSEKNGPNCAATRSCGFVIAHWAGAEGCDHYNIRERSGTQFEAAGTDRGQLHNQRSAQFPGPERFGPNNTIFVRVQGCSRNFFGKSSCTAWSNEVSLAIQPMASTTPPADAAKSASCNRYATGAIAQAKLARGTYKCDAATLSGPRWTATFAEHRGWCMGVDAASRDRENAERTRIMHECRVKAAGPKGGKAQITVTSKGGDTFFVTGSGFAPNAPVIIRLSGPGASIATVTVASNQRIIADAKGTLSVRLFGAQICKRGGGTVTFTAEDQDNHASPPATSKCAP